MKKEKLNYYNEFSRNINYALQSSTILKDFIEDFNCEISQEKENIVHKLENDADNNLHNILNYLVRDFLPPFDREDIMMLTHKIDDLEDNIDEIVINLNIFDIKKVRNDVKEFTNLIYEECKILKDMFDKLENKKNYKEIHEIVIKVNDLEEVGDRLYRNAIYNLFTTEKNAIEIIKWKNIYDCLEDCIDTCETIAYSVEEIIVKLS